ncbi:hypothetical protein CXG81DRAFT_20048 [Caulochytrium protostelioides]|uniref:Uncharacterized protein n=1 Tax=Caulochytrium protostelioides TaxID=1555241 RepID=A0A4P9X4D6_9FUNG|nr:hypothetical protein CXG81DRAFT_20048 [Caulochytrium protostelioides]|eukprot:RKO99936.1 hypothetical protein CXG81DRAFT_20048 [Caulochytrium protostelioides]
MITRGRDGLRLILLLVFLMCLVVTAIPTSFQDAMSSKTLDQQSIEYEVATVRPLKKVQTEYFYALQRRWVETRRGKATPPTLAEVIQIVRDRNYIPLIIQYYSYLNSVYSDPDYCYLAPTSICEPFHKYHQVHTSSLTADALVTYLSNALSEDLAQLRIRDEPKAQIVHEILTKSGLRYLKIHAGKILENVVAELNTSKSFKPNFKRTQTYKFAEFSIYPPDFLSAMLANLIETRGKDLMTYGNLLDFGEAVKKFNAHFRYLEQHHPDVTDHLPVHELNAQRAAVNLHLFTRISMPAGISTGNPVGHPLDYSRDDHVGTRHPALAVSSGDRKSRNQDSLREGGIRKRKPQSKKSSTIQMVAGKLNLVNNLDGDSSTLDGGAEDATFESGEQPEQTQPHTHMETTFESRHHSEFSEAAASPPGPLGPENGLWINDAIENHRIQSPHIVSPGNDDTQTELSFLLDPDSKFDFDELIQEMYGDPLLEDKQTQPAERTNSVGIPEKPASANEAAFHPQPYPNAASDLRPQTPSLSGIRGSLAKVLDAKIPR